MGVIAHPNRPSALPIRQHRQHSEDSQNNNSPSRLSTGTSLRLNNEPSRPRTINRSASIGLQLLQHSNQQKHHLPRGIDNAVRERMPLVCGVLWRSVAPVSLIQLVRTQLYCILAPRTKRTCQRGASQAVDSGQLFRFKTPGC